MLQVRIKVAWYDGIPARYRPGTSDENVLRELINRCEYRRVTFGFDVRPGEHWLNLGANVGAFGIYCRLREATALCYEPDPDCFELLEKNCPWFRCIRAAVTHQRAKSLPFNVSTRANNYYRGSVLDHGALRFRTTVPNVYCGDIKDTFDGVKMDIEGAEFGILDNELLPRCDKFVMEYHSSHDDCAEGFKRRVAYLQSRFKEVRYPREFDVKLAEGKSVKTYHDRNIFCWDPR